MTKYILQSGNVKNYPEKMKKYNEEIFRDFTEDHKNNIDRDIITVNKTVKVLFCFFSQKREDWETKYKDYSDKLKGDALVDLRLELEIKMASPDEFVAQCQWAEVIMIAGGDDDVLQYRMSKFDVPKIWEGKIVTGSSAGADYLVNSFWTLDWRKVMDGSGILPIKFIPHYRSAEYAKDDPRGEVDWKKAYEELENYGDKDLPIYTLKEGDFVVIEQ